MRSSLRHPHVSLRDTIAMKLTTLANPMVHPSPGHVEFDIAREIVDDLLEYIINELEELEEQYEQDCQDRWGWFDRLVSRGLLRAQGWVRALNARLYRC
jgi:hypothetical protein